MSLPSLPPEKIQQWMDTALELAREAAAQDEVPVGAIVVQFGSEPSNFAELAKLAKLEGTVIGKGYNLRETDQNPLAHAEVMAIQDAARNTGSWRLVNSILVVTLEPCPMCLAACQQARIEHVFYAATDPKGGALSLGYPLHADPKTNHRFLVSQHPHPECGKILSEFFAAKRKK